MHVRATLPPWPLTVAVVLASMVTARVIWHLPAGPYDLLTLAEQASQRGDMVQARELARAELRVQPLDGRAWRVLAQSAAADNDSRQVDHLLERALHYSPRDLQTRAMAAERAIARGDPATAVGHLDALLRMEPPLMEAVFPALAQLGTDPVARPALITSLARWPVWRWDFIPYLLRQTPRVDALEPLMIGLREHGGLEPSESLAWLNRYVADRHWDEAYRVWMRLLTAAQRRKLSMPINGDFEDPVTGGSPFEWMVSRNGGVEAVIARSETDGGHMLQLTFSGAPEPYGGVRQLVLLPSGGHFTLHWRSRLESLDTPRGLQWELSCAGTPDRVFLASPPERGTHEWLVQSQAFTVPAECPAQWLTLRVAARIASENQAIGTAWWDDVAIIDQSTMASGR